MPELAEVEYYRTQWNRGLGAKVLAVKLHSGKYLFRGTDTVALAKTLTGAKLICSETHGKQLMFRFSKDGWLGIHLGMTGKLRVEPPGTGPLKHDHLIICQQKQNLVFSDPRQFGRVLFHCGRGHPDWWRDRPAPVLSPQFTPKLVQEFLTRHGRAPIKALLLSQAGFPGIGNWMADEILWQSKIHPSRPAAKLGPEQVRALHAKVRSISRIALRSIGRKDADPPKSWLFHRRWKAGGTCPIDGSKLCRGTIGGRTTCWCQRCQKAVTRL